MKLPLLPLLLLATAPAALAAPLPIDLAKSQLAFVSKQMNVPVEGTFRKFTGQLDFDAKKPEAAKARLDIEMGSVDAGSAEANAEVIRKAWFNTSQFPQASFVSTALKPLGGNRYELAGQMTIKGKTHPLSAPVTVKPAGTGQSFEGTFVLKRLDYGIGDGPWNDPDTVANEVQVRFKLVTK